MNTTLNRYSIVFFVAFVSVFLGIYRPLQARSFDASENSSSNDINKDSNLADNSISIPNNSLINKLFAPNSSELFFREGREKFDREIDYLLDRRLTVSDDLLKIQDDIFQQQQELENNPQLNITPDSIDIHGCTPRDKRTVILKYVCKTSLF
jgi:exonuclease V gamma subunit